MIFVTVGTHNQEFTRLVKRLDEIAPKINEKIIIQRGYTAYIPKNCESFEWAPSLDKYYKKARLVISHGGSSVWEFVYKYKRPIIIIPRQYKFKEHINNHQVEFAESFEQKTGTKAIYDMKDLTPELLKKYNKVYEIKRDNLKRLQEYLKKIIEEITKKDKII